MTVGVGLGFVPYKLLSYLIKYTQGRCDVPIQVAKQRLDLLTNHLCFQTCTVRG